MLVCNLSLARAQTSGLDSTGAHVRSVRVSNVLAGTEEGAQSRVWGTLCLRTRRLGRSIPLHRPRGKGSAVAARRGCEIYIAAECTIALLLGAWSFLASLSGHELHAAFARGNAVFLPYAITSFVGIGTGW